MRDFLRSHETAGLALIRRASRDTFSRKREKGAQGRRGRPVIDDSGTPRRRERARAPRATQAATPQLPRLAVPWAPLDVFSADEVERLLEAAFTVLQEIGLEIRS
ncbi:MAG: hypothetical protein JOY94_09615, partial [Methylobacteriaceae bacterium]|nr:hypothetical protein [Methylobacteriaceae bacterium]